MKEGYSPAVRNISALKTLKSLSLDDIVRDVHLQVMSTKMPDEMKMFVVNRLSEIEYRLAQGCNEKA